MTQTHLIQDPIAILPNLRFAFVFSYGTTNASFILNVQIALSLPLKSDRQ